MKNVLSRASAVGAVLMLAIGLTACSSGGGPSNAASKADFDLKPFDQATAANLKGATSWPGPTVKFTPPKTGKLAIIECDSTLSGCVDASKAAQTAAEALGWTATLYNGKSDPATQNQLVTQAAETGATAIITNSIDPAQIKAGLAAAKAKGIPVGSINGGGTGGVFNFDIGANWKAVGAAEADWMISDSKGTAYIQPLNDLEFGSVVAQGKGEQEEWKKCTSCTVLPTVNFVASDVGNGLGTKVTGLLQRNPKVNYVAGTYDPAISDMVPAIHAVGIQDRVKITGSNGTAQNLKFIQDGNVQAADVAFDAKYTGWMAIDAMARTLAKQPLYKTTATSDPDYVYAGNVPFILYTKSNLPSDLNQVYEAPIDTESHFKALWGLQ